MSLFSELFEDPGTVSNGVRHVRDVRNSGTAEVSRFFSPRADSPKAVSEVCDDVRKTGSDVRCLTSLTSEN